MYIHVIKCIYMQTESITIDYKKYIYTIVVVTVVVVVVVIIVVVVTVG